MRSMRSTVSILSANVRAIAASMSRPAAASTASTCTSACASRAAHLGATCSDVFAPSSGPSTIARPSCAVAVRNCALRRRNRNVSQVRSTTSRTQICSNVGRREHPRHASAQIIVGCGVLACDQRGGREERQRGARIDLRHGGAGGGRKLCLGHALLFPLARWLVLWHLFLFCSKRFAPILQGFSTYIPFRPCIGLMVG